MPEMMVCLLSLSTRTRNVGSSFEKRDRALDSSPRLVVDREDLHVHDRLGHVHVAHRDCTIGP
jgi:hypothetical protein